MDKKKNQRGSLTLETAMVLPIFIMMMLLIFSLFSVISAHNQISHAFIQTTKSLSLDSYLFAEMDLATESSTVFWDSSADMFVDLSRVNKNTYFMNRWDWSEPAGADASQVAKQRFVGYLAGGDETKADELLKNLGVENGLEGVQLYLTVDANQIMHIKISYKLQYLFDFWKSEGMQVNQTLQAKMLK